MREIQASEILDAWNDSIASFIRRLMEFVDEAERLRGHAKTLDIWLVTKLEAGGETGDEL
jgi:hypothetical protein